jgi:membrane-bound lytic murein transglycosylase D
MKSIIWRTGLLFLTFVLTLSASNTDSSTQAILNNLNGESEVVNPMELFDLLFAEAKSYYVEALVANHFNDSSEVKYCIDRTLEAISEISSLDTLTLLQRDDYERFCEKLTYDMQTIFDYLNGDVGNLVLDGIREEISESILDTVDIGDDKLIVIQDRPGGFPIVTSKKIQSIINYFTTKEHQRFQEWLDNSGLYKEHMLPILRKYHVPDELFYLALIESGFSPIAYSSAHAAGQWQFIASTGARYGLKRNWWVDERRDPIKSTEAAAQYLSDLYQEFNDWFLALAAYNYGELRIHRAIRREGTRDYWKLRSLPRETRNYIPTLMAGMIIALEPEKYGFTNTPKDSWDWDEVVLDRSYDLEDLSKACGVSAHVLRDYNQELRRWMTPPDVKEYIIRVPKGKAELLAAKLEALPESDQPQFVTHRVGRGETLSSIARRYGTSISAIVAANNIRNANRLKIGQLLQIPGSQQYTASYSSSTEECIVHVVSRGETLSGIAESYKVGLSKVRSLNNLHGNRFIYPGQKIKVPANGSSPTADQKIVHVVQRGDTLTKIAKRYNVRLSSVRSWNNIYGNQLIYPGQKIVIYR